MEPYTNDAPLIAIVGETGSGKSALAMHIAETFNGEIICADSRTIYKGMDIGTAKPTVAERQRVHHYALDIVEPSQQFSAASFKAIAEQSIQTITSHNKIPIIVGGTGLYADAVLFDYEFSSQPDYVERQRLGTLTVEELQAEITKKGIAMPENQKNPRHLMRAIETGGTSRIKRNLRSNTLIIGLQVSREVLKTRISKRVDNMFARGLTEEVTRLYKAFGWEAPGMRSPGYREFEAYFNGNQTIEEVHEKIIRNHLQLAKRQRTWFKRNKSIHWVSNQEEAVELVTTILNK